MGEPLPVTTDECYEVLRWLLLRPDEFATVLTLAQMERGVGTEYAPQDEHVTAFLHAARHGYCVHCFYPIVMYPDGTWLGWPLLERHDCS